ncbi:MULTISPECIES: hypothetical protein [unclassified Treponema]|uniref:hypothetical protein n=1 Tax=unclassified Treponema TaxID=2638727 RepID=UPI0020A40425|nr:MULTISPECIES: hypothetical protein [unclassified Treponema]UTC67140.1 hypothetical protein E4O06_00250 [Treponema sp. OMZ 789]UTC69870.1 hypothetical protein E4O01_00250 [Treponema sp. OMZ 790]UTC72585.1 hypothetical protein E4O02_00250 [Treponema sp. OMZ 791]
MAKFKIPLICAAAALILAFLLGLISGVRFSVIILRSLIIFLISGGFVLGAQILLEHFVPDLFQPVDAQEKQRKETGKNLNISIDEPIEVPFENDEEGTNMESAMFEDEETYESSISDDDEFNELESIQADVDTIKGSTSLAGEEPSNEKTEENTVKELEELPDLQDFIPEDELQQGDDQMDFTQRGTSAFDVSTDLSGSGMDTNTMVSAIRTVLKRDS